MKKLYIQAFFIYTTRRMNFKFAAVTFSIFILAAIIALGTSQSSTTTMRSTVVSSTSMPTNGGNNNSMSNNSTNTGGNGSLTTKGVVVSATTEALITTTKGISTVLPSICVIFVSFLIANLSIHSILI
uniref:Uncharacterized protein n=1 Tax=Strongyloides papillosus TaxID=174720 RepID=A0A0N5B4V6_STREA